MSDERPPVWIGHAFLTVSDVDRSADFWRDLGMREIDRNEHVAVLELRGGTHLLLLPGEPPKDADVHFDLMVEDIDATRAEWEQRGLDVSPIGERNFHRSFTVRDPDGYRLMVNSSHVEGPV